MVLSWVLCFLPIHQKCVWDTHPLQKPVYADDITLYISAKSAENIGAMLQKNLQRLLELLERKGLVLNPSRSLFRPKSRADTPDLQQVCKEPVSRVGYVKYLAIIVDEFLSFDRQVAKVCGSK